MKAMIMMSDTWLEVDKGLKELAAFKKRSEERKRQYAEYEAQKQVRDAEEWARKASVWLYIGLIIVCILFLVAPGVIQNLSK